MHRFHFAIFVAFIYFSSANAAPIKEDSEDHYDQRQNGTENYRINVDGVLFAVAPAEALLSSSSDIEELLGLLDYEGLDSQFPVKSTTEAEKKPTVDEAVENDINGIKAEPEKPNSVKKVG